MKDIIISNVTYQMIVKSAENPFRHDGVKLSSGKWLIPIGDETWDKLNRIAEPGEVFDDVIQRIVNFSLGTKAH